MSFAVVMEGMTLIAFVVMITGGKQKRESGWRVISGLLVFVGLIQCTAMALVVSALILLSPIDDVDNRYFHKGTRLILQNQKLRHFYMITKIITFLLG